MMLLTVEYRKDAAKYLDSLDSPTRDRIKAKISDVASDPSNPRHSLPLVATEKRKARVGKYRILILVLPKVLLITEIDSRGQIYRAL